MLAPTTVLVEQHFRTLTERFAGFPVSVGKLSRFQSKAEQLETVKQLAEGKLDVVVGTHRLLSRDVRFKDLGLLVIDEEQRFGVAHKERIKKPRTQVDVLTLTATPIPRTLHLAMAGLRDLSIIATPPADRRAVRTFVSRVDDATIREAIERELARGGQVFFITPTIGHDAAAARAGSPAAERRAPAAQTQAARRRPHDRRVGRVHPRRWSRRRASASATARCRPSELEKVMVDFVDGELDVLVATTIIESGLDIPRANTMFVARADAFGLAQLYQLRGRIGRSQGARVLLPARARARAHHRRGAPPARGAAAVHRARRRLPDRVARPRDPRRRRAARRQAVRLDRGGRLRAVRARCSRRRSPSCAASRSTRAIDPELTIETPGFIPDDYVPDPGQRLELYKRLSGGRRRRRARAP